MLESARVLMMERGFNGFSFRDIAENVGIKSASIHYHYATKADLAEATARAYRLSFNDSIEQIDAGSAAEKLRAYGAMFVTTLREQEQVCLGGMLVADVASLPAQVRAEVARFFGDQNDWIERVVREGQAAGQFRADLDAAMFAKVFVSSLEGAMMVSRGLEQPQDLEDALDMLVKLLDV
ncbi:TetR family transcriptional regulator [Sulfitobacter donghicola DSW-25 = KCTC 12864 = JCM 14565]|uniref:TetR family transcriptional regulator n=1 Tax=Sulfitobacter donghicola DSW-25 = KCTC 12864 = JCM 14565 TaxID=1300350 RepID=A0A073IJV4_9RHOB|nr:TetR family transcriptional regulator [Sulfitobacter donghicola DSW-25 = KCTC 12864 = JCM 14565]